MASQPWQGSTRRDRLPPDWGRIRKRIGRRDRWLCQVYDPQLGRVCLEPANEVDHIRAGDDHSDHNLRCICNWHHKRKSSSEGGNALAVKRKRIASRHRDEEPHPGAL